MAMTREPASHRAMPMTFSKRVEEWMEEKKKKKNSLLANPIV
jgi:hypothetical protein